jgi:hypothetical protein
MQAIDRVQLVLEAIESVKKRLNEAKANGDLSAYRKLGGDLLYLETTLVPETEALVREIKKIA